MFKENYVSLNLNVYQLYLKFVSGLQCFYKVCGDPVYKHSKCTGCMTVLAVNVFSR